MWDIMIPGGSGCLSTSTFPLDENVVSSVHATSDKQNSEDTPGWTSITSASGPDDDAFLYAVWSVAQQNYLRRLPLDTRRMRIG